MMKHSRLLMLSAIILLTGCSGIQVNQDYDPATDFKSMTDYDWAEATQEKTGDLRIDNPLRDARIRAAVERHLQEKGYLKTSDQTPTFLVRYRYVLRQRVESDNSGVGFGIGSYGRHGGIAIGTGNSIREYDQGSLVIDFLDPTSNTLLWRGNGNQRFREYDDPEKTSRDIDTLVDEILSQFPPKT
jgi:hypothetical protein